MMLLLLLDSMVRLLVVGLLLLIKGIFLLLNIFRTNGFILMRYVIIVVVVAVRQPANMPIRKALKVSEFRSRVEIGLWYLYWMVAQK